MTVASAVQPFRSRSMRTLSSNSSGKLERKIACSNPPYSTTVASFNRAFPARRAVICTGTRTGLARGKKRANRSAQPCSFAVTVASSGRLTSPLNSPYEDQRPLRSGTRTSANGHNVPAIEVHAARQRGGNVRGPEIKESERLRIFPSWPRGSRVSR